jgi:DNA-binding transcriptional ArsR family regulator
MNKRYIDIFTTLPNAGPDSLGVLAVYSHLVYQDEYGSVPTATNVADYTGLARNTVSSHIGQLKDAGLLAEDGLVVEQILPWAVAQKKFIPNKHWRKKYATWKLYARNPDSELSFLALALYSFILHCRETGYKPRRGFTNRYLCSVLKCNEHTVRELLGSLEHHRFLRMEDKTIKWMTPNDYILAQYQDQEKDTGTEAYNMEWEDDEQQLSRQPVATSAPDVAAVVARLRNYIRLPTVHLCGLASDLVRMDCWGEEHEEILLAIYNACHHLQNKANAGEIQKAAIATICESYIDVGTIDD